MDFFKLTIILLFNISFSQDKITIVDQNTKAPISYVSIAFDKSDNGFFSDKKGTFKFEKLVGVNEIYISCLGYESKLLNINKINDIIFLKPKGIDLPEIIFSNKKSKLKTIKVKDKSHNNFLDGHMVAIGEELCYLIKTTKTSTQLKNITIPIITKTISFENKFNNKKQTVKKLHFSTLYKISFYSNDNGKPSDIVVNDEITTVLNQKRRKNSIDLEKYNIEIPKNGLFVGLKNLGPIDDNGKLISKTPYRIIITKNGNKKTLNITKPYFPVLKTESEVKTYHRQTFGVKKDWRQFYQYGGKKSNEIHNISLGYKIDFYE